MLLAFNCLYLKAKLYMLKGRTLIMLIVFNANIFTLKAQTLSLNQANELMQLPIKCIHQEYPNKLSNVLASEMDLGAPKTLHPAFYGCFDWHSAVHGHWSLSYIANQFKGLERIILPHLEQNIQYENVQTELAYFLKKHEYSYERTYGWNWLMKLQLELEQSPSPEQQKMAKELFPLTQEIAKRYITFLPKLNYPIRVGTHTNTAFGMTFAYDYAQYKGLDSLQNMIEVTALRLFKNDKDYPLKWEPNGTDFLSPAMEEIDLMSRVMPKEQFLIWLQAFLPEILNPAFDWEPAKVSDRSDGHLVHLDGLNFSRAWVMYRLVKKFPQQLGHLKTLADKHLNYSLPQLVDGNYEGEHWLATFALYALQSKENLDNKNNIAN